MKNAGKLLWKVTGIKNSADHLEATRYEGTTLRGDESWMR